MHRWGLDAIGWLGLAGVAGCGWPSEAFTRVSETIEGPQTGPWQHASVQIDYEPGHSTAHGKKWPQLEFWLTLDGGGQARTLELDYFAAAATGPERKAFQHMLDAKFSLAFSPTGDALAISVDAGDSYRMVSFVPEDPLYCVHETFALTDDWSAAPEPRALMLSILASADPPSADATGTLHLEVGETPRARSRFDTEFAVARQYACTHLDDAEFRTAVVSALVRPGSQLFGSDAVHKLITCVSEALRVEPGAAAQLVASLSDDGPRLQQARAARALADSPAADSVAQQAIARALSATPMPCSRAVVSCSQQAGVLSALAWALATVSAKLDAVDAVALDALLYASQADKPAIVAHAVRGLAGSTDPKAVARLREIAAGECATEFAELPPTLVPYGRLRRGERAPACWAKAALANVAGTAPADDPAPTPTGPAAPSDPE